MKTIRYVLLSVVALFMIGCHATNQPVVKTEATSTAKESPALIPMVQQDDSAEMVACIQQDLKNPRSYLRAISKECSYDANHDLNIMVTSYRSGVIDGWYAGTIQINKMQFFGAMGVSQFFPFSDEEMDLLQKALSKETEKEKSFAIDADEHKASLQQVEPCINSDIRVYLYDLGYNCGMLKTTARRCDAYSNAFVKVCEAGGESNSKCNALYKKTQPDFCK